jgi:hypothetical protein
LGRYGEERETVICLMQKAINMHATGKGAMAIKSAVVQDHLKSYVYIEAGAVKVESSLTHSLESACKFLHLQVVESFCRFLLQVYKVSAPSRQVTCGLSESFRK